MIRARGRILVVVGLPDTALEGHEAAPENPPDGLLIAALLIGVLGSRARERNSIIAVLTPFDLGLGILCLTLYSGRVANKFGLLTEQIVAVDNPRLLSLLIMCGIVVAGLLVVWRPLMFVTIGAQVAEARGVRTVALSLVFMILLGLVTAVSVQIVGALLVLSVLVTPAAAALRVSASPGHHPESPAEVRAGRGNRLVSMPLIIVIENLCRIVVPMTSLRRRRTRW